MTYHAAKSAPKKKGMKPMMPREHAAMHPNGAKPKPRGRKKAQP